jgi:hypothetical protein
MCEATAGIIWEISLRSNLGLRTEFNVFKNNAGYNTYGSLHDFGLTTSGNYSNTYSSFSFDIPLLLTYSFQRIAFLAGPYFSLPENWFTGLARKTSYSYTSGTTGAVSTSFSMDPKKITSSRFGLATGVEYRLPLTIPGEVTVDARYILDLTSINSVYTRRGLLVSIGYNFH